MKLKDLIKKKGFWVAVAGAVVLAAQLFGIKIELPYINEAISSLCAVLVALGLMSATDKEEIDNSLREIQEEDEKEDKKETKE